MTEFVVKIVQIEIRPGLDLPEQFRMSMLCDQSFLRNKEVLQASVGTSPDAFLNALYKLSVVACAFLPARSGIFPLASCSEIQFLYRSCRQYFNPGSCVL
jgi:hypothetical protein